MDQASNLLSQLSRDDKIKLLADIIGYRVIPVDIDTFIHDNYYLGNTCGLNPDTKIESVYRIWRDALKKIFPDPITTNTFIANIGAIGTGKSTMAKIVMCYDIYKITCLKNPSGYFETIQKYLHFKIFNLQKWKGDQMAEEMIDWLEKSPYFQELKRDNKELYSWIRISGASRMQDIISDDVVSVIFSEMNFVRDFDQGIKIINQGISRIESRYQKGFGLFNHIILDSSDTTVDAPVPYFLKTHTRAPETLVFKYAIWDAKPDMYNNIVDPDTGKTTFTVYKGDAEIHPCIVTKDTPIAKMDADRFIEIPNELRKDFEADIILALNEKAGVAVDTTNQYFQPDKIIKSMTYDMGGIPEIISVDFFGDESYISYFEDIMNRLPHDRCLFGRVDLGISGDRAGFAIGYIESMCKKDIDGVVSYDPTIVVPIATTFSRYTGQETSIHKITDLIIWMHSIIPFYSFTTDTFQSFAIKQKLIESGINASFLSVDRTTEHHKIAKQLIYRGKVTLPQNTLLKNEMINLIDMGNKIDHHLQLNAAGDIGSNSKDCSDAVIGLISDMSRAKEEAMMPPLVSNTQRSVYEKKLIDEWYDTNKNKIYEMQRIAMFGR